MASGCRKHLLLLPFPAYGHVIPLLELGKKIARCHDVTFAVSGCLFQQIQDRQLISPSDLNLVRIPDGWEDQWDANNIVKEGSGKQMMDSVFPAVKWLLENIPTATSKSSEPGLNVWGITTPVEVVIGDNILAGPLATCHEREIPFFLFNTPAATFTWLALCVDEEYPALPPDQDDSRKFQETPLTGRPMSPIPAALKSLLLTISATIPLSKGIIFNSVREMEEEALQKIQAFPNTKATSMHCLGPLVQSNEMFSVANLEQQEKVREWLETKAANTVVYLSFGSIAFPAPEQTAEIAQALLQLDQPFIWSLPPGQHQYLPDYMRGEIAKQFEVVDGRLLVLPWAPQRLILQHQATAVFLTHCGWNSTLETVMAGVPVVAWPMMDDQKVNAEWLESRSMAVIIEGTGLKAVRIVPTAEILDAICRVGFSGMGPNRSVTPYREAVKAWSRKLQDATCPGGSSEINFEKLLNSF